jgi:hypothetical protein
MKEREGRRTTIRRGEGEAIYRLQYVLISIHDIVFF